MTTLILVRHGQTAWNRTQRVQGHRDVPLSDEGYSAVATLRRHVRRLHPQHALCSDLLRARQTAAALGWAHPTFDPRLRGMHGGIWEGHSRQSLPAHALSAWYAGNYAPPGGETWDMLCTRIAAVLAGIPNQDTPWLIVTHARVIQAAYWLLTNTPREHIGIISNASLTVIDRGNPSRIRVLSHTFHDLTR